MRNRQLFALTLIALSLGACDWITGRHDEDDQPGNEVASAEGKAEAGQVAVKAPGLDVTFTVPKALTRDVKVHNDITSLYPKASITGMYAAGGQEDDKTEVEFRFVSDDAPDRILAWYRDPARSALFKLRDVSQQGGETLVRGREKGEGSDFKVRLAARNGGGTDGRIVLRKK